MRRPAQKQPRLLHVFCPFATQPASLSPFLFAIPIMQGWMRVAEFRPNLQRDAKGCRRMQRDAEGHRETNGRVGSLLAECRDLQKPAATCSNDAWTQWAVYSWLRERSQMRRFGEESGKRQENYMVLAKNLSGRNPACLRLFVYLDVGESDCALALWHPGTLLFRFISLSSPFSRIFVSLFLPSQQDVKIPSSRTSRRIHFVSRVSPS